MTIVSKLVTLGKVTFHISHVGMKLLFLSVRKPSRVFQLAQINPTTEQVCACPEMYDNFCEANAPEYDTVFELHVALICEYISRIPREKIFKI